MGEDTYNIWLIMDQISEVCYFPVFLVRITSQGPEYNQKTQFSKLMYIMQGLGGDEKHPGGGEGKSRVRAKFPLELLRVKKDSCTPPTLAPRSGWPQNWSRLGTGRSVQAPCSRAVCL